MSLIKCRECGNEVSTEAEKCPKCGASVEAKSMGCGAKIGIAFVVLIGVGLLGNLLPSTPPAAPLKSYTPDTPAKLPAPDPKVMALSALKIKKLSWYKGGFDNVMLVDVTFQNNGQRGVKDIELTCDHYAKSGTKIDSNKKTVYEAITSGKSRTLKKFSMGFIHSQAATTNCEITDLVVM